MKNYYDELEVSRNASSEVISRAYKVLAKKYHPDTTTEDKKIAEEKFKKISEAYEVLSNEQKRAEYDKTLQPEIDSDRYNKVLHDNKIMAEQLSNLKSKINTNNSQPSRSNPNINNTTYSRQAGNTYSQNSNSQYSQQGNPYYQQQNNQYYQQPNNNGYYYTTRPQTRREPTFLEILKYKFNMFVKKIIALFFIIVIIAAALGILYSIPATKHFLINDLHLDLLYLLFK